MNILLTLPILLVAISCIFASSQETNNVASKSDPSDDGKNDLLIRQAYTLAKELLDSSSSNEEEQEDDHHENNTENKVNEDKNRDEEDEIVEELLDWIITNGGYIHPNAHIKFVPPTQSYRGVFVKNVNEEGGTPEGIKKGDIICKIPWEIIIKPSQYNYNNYWDCDGVNELYRQFQLGEDSFYAPYIRYILNQPRGRTPQDWTVGGMRLLDVITNKEHFQQHDQEQQQHDDNDDGRIMNRLPPTYKTSDFQQWLDECNGEDTPLSRHAVYQYISRDEDTLLIPFYDIHNHSNNPTKLNSHILKPKHPGKSFVLKSSRDIHPGEQIYISYNKCHPCWFDTTFRGCKSFSNYGSSDIFFVYGFVEDWPQYWNYKIVTSRSSSDEDVVIEEVEFCISPTSGEENDNNELHAHFVDSDYIPSHEHITWFAQHLLRLNEVKLSMKNDLELKQSMPSHEWDNAWLYYQSLVTSISLAIVEAIDSSTEKSEAAAANQQSLDGMLDELSCEE